MHRLIGWFLILIFLAVPFKIADAVPRWARKSTSDKVMAVALCLVLGGGEGVFGYMLYDGIPTDYVRGSSLQWQTVVTRFPVEGWLGMIGGGYLALVGGTRAVLARAKTSKDT